MIEISAPSATASTTPPPWSTIHDNEVYIVNPLYRLHNSSHYVLAWGVQGLPPEKVHRSAGVTAALCDGKRTVEDIARITRPLVKIPDDAKAIETARAYVKAIIHTLRQTPDEREGRPPEYTDLPAATILLAKKDYDQKFAHEKYVTINYQPCDYLPKNEAELGSATGLVAAANRREASPVTINWHLTSECSTDCRYCYLGRRKVKNMDKARTLALIDEAASIGVSGISPSGGDVLLYPHLDDVLTAMCKYRFLPIELATKTFLSKEAAKALARSASVLIAVQFSIDSTVPDVADYLVRARGYTDRILASIDNALEAGLKVNAKAVITPYNILTIPKLYRDLRKRGVDTVRLAAYTRSGYHHTDDLFNHGNSWQWLQEQTKQLQQEFPTDRLNLQNGGPILEPLSAEARRKSWPTRSACTAGRTGMMICADGKVIPCEQMPETDEYFCGDVSRQSILDVWNSDRLREFTYAVPKERFTGQICYDCEEREDCTNLLGNCIRDLANLHGSVFQPPPNCPKHDRPFLRMT